MGTVRHQIIAKKVAHLGTNMTHRLPAVRRHATNAKFGAKYIDAWFIKKQLALLEPLGKKQIGLLDKIQIREWRRECDSRLHEYRLDTLKRYSKRRRPSLRQIIFLKPSLAFRQLTQRIEIISQTE